MAPPSFSTNQACREVGMTYRQLDHWQRLGVLVPEIAAAAGQGTARRFSLRDLRLLRLLVTLRCMGALLDVLADTVRAVRHDPLEGGTLYVSPTGEVVRDPEAAGQLWACWWTVNLDAVLSGARHPAAAVTAA